jgi:hypothetical protein
VVGRQDPPLGIGKLIDINRLEKIRCPEAALSVEHRLDGSLHFRWRERYLDLT